MNPILILDDDPGRHVAFREHFEAQGVPIIHAATVSSAIDALKKHNSGEQTLSGVFLDHDLGEFGPSEYDSSKQREYTGRDVADWMRHNVNPDGLSVRIHSWNIAAGKTMELTLRDVGFDVHSGPFKMSDGDYDEGSGP
jgi:CheY-like chemotaxis protein